MIKSTSESNIPIFVGCPSSAAAGATTNPGSATNATPNRYMANFINHGGGSIE